MTEYVGAIEKQTLQNLHFRQVLFTAQHSQLVVMCLRPGEEIDDEVHANVDQFFRIEQGDAKFVFNEKEERTVHQGDAVLVPAGTYHNVPGSCLRRRGKDSLQSFGATAAMKGTWRRIGFERAMLR